MIIYNYKLVLLSDPSRPVSVPTALLSLADFDFEPQVLHGNRFNFFSCEAETGGGQREDEKKDGGGKERC